MLITTTTHMFMPTSHWPVVFFVIRHASSCVLTSPISFCFTAGKRTREVQGFTPEAIDALCNDQSVT
ncbi:hypothetical protein ACVXHA_24555 [Escherichia coli]